MTLALLVTACLLVKSLISLRGVDPGFNADRVVLAEVNLSQRRYAPERWSAIYDQVVDGLSALPGVRAVGAGAPLPLSGQPGLLRFGLVIDGRPPLAAQVDRIYLRWATPGYFTAMGIPVRQGRAFSRDDRADSLPVAIVDEAFAARHFPGENALGHRVRPTSDSTWREIVGVVGKVRQTSLDGDAEPHLYVAAAQFPTPAITFVVRGDGDPASLAAGVRAAVHSVDPAEPVFNVRTLRDVVSDATTPQRFNASVIALFAGCAGFLTVLGIYGVTSRWVSDSTRELGVQNRARRRSRTDPPLDRGARIAGHRGRRGDWPRPGHRGRPPDRDPSLRRQPDGPGGHCGRDRARGGRHARRHPDPGPTRAFGRSGDLACGRKPSGTVYRRTTPYAFFSTGVPRHLFICRTTRKIANATMKNSTTALMKLPYASTGAFAALASASVA